MAKMYAKLIKAGRMTISQVPEVLRSEVEALIDE